MLPCPSMIILVRRWTLECAGCIYYLAHILHTFSKTKLGMDLAPNHKCLLFDSISFTYRFSNLLYPIASFSTSRSFAMITLSSVESYLSNSNFETRVFINNTTNPTTTHLASPRNRRRSNSIVDTLHK